jgi:hypothetical protein
LKYKVNVKTFAYQENFQNNSFLYLINSKAGTRITFMKTIKLNRNKVYIIGVAAILAFVAINRLNYIIGSKFATGKVINTHKWSTRTWRGGGSNFTAPIIRFRDGDYEITFTGETNDELTPDETVKVIYKADDPTEAEVFDFTGFLLPSLLYSLIPLLLLSAAAFSFIDAKEIVVIHVEKMYKLSFNKEKNSGKIN